MSRHALLGFPVLALFSIAGWWGCATAKPTPFMGAGGSSSSSSSSVSTGGAGGGSGGSGGVPASGGSGGAGGSGDAGVCVPSTTTLAAHFPLDLVFAIDQSSGNNDSWASIVKQSDAFFMDSAPSGVRAGLLLFPYSADDCDLDHYKTLTVPVGALPANAVALVNAFPANAVGVGLPLYPALQGALEQATALKDANPTHAVHVVLVTSGEADICDMSNDDLATLTGSALAYNGVLTHVIALPGAYPAYLGAAASAGGTTSVEDLTADVGPYTKVLDTIRAAGLGCSFELPNTKPFDPGTVNVSYKPKGTGPAIVLLRAADLAGCNAQPGWFYDVPGAPTKIVLCPESCATIEDDTDAEVDLLLGCASQSQ